MQNKSENEIKGDKINAFIQRNRKNIFLSLCIIVILLAGSVAALSINDVLRKKSIAEVGEFSKRYETLRQETASDSSDTEALLENLNNFAKGKSGFAGGKAWSIIAQIHRDRKEWSEAEDAWLNAAKASLKTYLGPVSFYNAAVAAEEQGKWKQAVEHYEKSLSVPVEFPAAPHAQFAIGRLYEEMDDVPAAVEAYRVVLNKWPNITTWVSLANSRIIALETR
ncbi:MAG: tetratricopeptide repeat protein [Treponema sp.]|jgi:tetratricopeptide (TPR) repeat protein|nr:tetratricopeptide repeat protein [Treponema sp.]